MDNEERFGFTGRVLHESFTGHKEVVAAKRKFWGEDIEEELAERGIIIRSASKSILAEEADPAYKDVDRIVEISDSIGIAMRVARLAPIAVVKG